MPRRTDAHPADLRRALRRQLEQIAARIDIVTLCRRELRHCRSLLSIARERADHELAVARSRDELRARREPQHALVVVEAADDGGQARREQRRQLFGVRCSRVSIKALRASSPAERR